MSRTLLVGALIALSGMSGNLRAAEEEGHSGGSSGCGGMVNFVRPAGDGYEYRHGTMSSEAPGYTAYSILYNRNNYYELATIPGLAESYSLHAYCD